MKDIPRGNTLTSFLSADRGVSPVIAVALLILIAIGFAVAIQGVGGDIIDGVQQPPEANIDGNPSEEELRLTIQSVQNADQVRIQVDGEQVHNWEDPSSGQTHTVSKDDDDEWDEDSNQITVVAVNLPDDERVVYTYEIP